VPELAARDHIRRVLPLTRGALAAAGCTLADVDAVAYTEGPGLAGALLVGASVAHGLAYALDVPALGIHHLEGHLLSALMAEPAPQFPFVALLVSGGHTQLMRVTGVGQYLLLGDTLDDAAGEAFDKTAQLLGLGYPGGAALAALAVEGQAGRISPAAAHAPQRLISISASAGLKTAVLMQVKGRVLDTQARADVAAEFQAAIVDVLVAKSLAALEATGLSQLVVAGGVGANQNCAPGSPRPRARRNAGFLSGAGALHRQRRDDCICSGATAYRVQGIEDRNSDRGSRIEDRGTFPSNLGGTSSC
jgi:N6-L-threonylcarbamoyladenine synthase